MPGKYSGTLSMIGSSAASYESYFDDNDQCYLIDDQGNQYNVSYTVTSGVMSYTMAPGVTVPGGRTPKWIANNKASIQIENAPVSTAPTLPIKILSFTGRTGPNGSYKLQLIVNEYDVDRFELQRSTDNANYSTLNAQPSRGTGTRQTYDFVDPNPVFGNNLYRIKSVDKDGSVSYSSIIRHNNTLKDPGISIYPKPVQTTMMVKAPTSHPIQSYNIIDTGGRIVIKGTMIEGTQQIDMSRLPAGTYYFQAMVGNKTVKEQFIKQ
jgi:Secretion system C-terminal sorting domain